jgi:peptidoglycan/xylan/chitin deacetylase (PgdA/CDA1 family)
MLQKLLLLSSFIWALFADAHIFVYHRFDDNRYPSTNTTLKELQKEFQYLKDRGYKVISLQELAKGLNRGEIDDKWVVLTVDDGYKSFLKALPLIKKYQYPITIFVSTKPALKKYPDFLNFNELKELSKSNLITIAFHSHSHPHLCDLSDKKIKEDTEKGINLFKKYLKFTPKFYAYPYGEYDLRVQKIISNYNFLGICNQNRGAISVNSSVFDLDRIALVGKSNLKRALNIKHLNVEWIEPIRYPKNHILKRIVAKIEPKYKEAYVYVTGYSWKKVAVKDGLIDEELNLKLKKRRVRVIIKVKNSKINTKILVRSRYGDK